MPLDPGLPLGVFDSGLGGLTVVREIAAALPGERILYLGDTARVPYGTRSAATVVRYAQACARALVERGVKALVVACNTVSAVAIEVLRADLDLPVLGVIEPGARAALAASRRGRVGVIGTEATVRSGAYPKALAAGGAKARSRACPLFVPLVEEGWWDGPVVESVARRYTAPLKGVDTLILGCTHYPFLKPVLAKVMGKGVALIDSAEETARETQLALERLGLRARAGRRGRREFYASDAPERFRRLARRMLGSAVPGVKLHPFDS